MDFRALESSSYSSVKKKITDHFKPNNSLMTICSCQSFPYVSIQKTLHVFYTDILKTDWSLVVFILLQVQMQSNINCFWAPFYSSARRNQILFFFFSLMVIYLLIITKISVCYKVNIKEAINSFPNPGNYFVC